MKTTRTAEAVTHPRSHHRPGRTRHAPFAQAARRFVRRLAPGIALAAALGLAAPPARADVTGNLAGEVRDKDNGDPVSGVAVIVSGPALQTEQRELTNSSGRFLLPGLPPGEYAVRFEFGELRADRPGIVVHADQTARIYVKLPVQQPPAGALRLGGRGGNIDSGGAQVQTPISDDLVRRLPIGSGGFRTYEDVLTLAPTSRRDGAGVSLSGSTGLENNFLLDGLDTTDPFSGGLGTRLSLEFIRETNVVTSGFDVQYGRSTGGLVNVVTKSGSNQLHGGAWFYAQPFQLTSPVLGALGDTIARTQRIQYALDFGFDLGGPLRKDRVWFYVGFHPQLRTDLDDRLVRQRLADGRPPSLPPDAPYAGDVDPNPRCPAWLGDPALCPPGGYLTRTLADATTSYRSSRRLYNWIAKLSFQPSENHHLALEYVGSPETFEGVSGAFTGSPGSFLSRTTVQTHDVLGRLHSNLASRNVQLDLLLGYHHSARTTRPLARSGGDLPSNLDTRSGPLTRFEDIAPCRPTASPAFDPCPLAGYRDGGLGALSSATASRFQAKLGLAFFFRLFGSHALRIGGDVQANQYTSRRSFTGPEGARYTTLADGSVERQQYVTTDPVTGQIQALPQGIETRSRSVSESLYALDTWSLAFVPGLILYGGVRWEPEQLKDASGATRLSFNRNVSPRVGFLYDWQRRGVVKFFLNYGTLYESVPLTVADRLFASAPTSRQIAAPGDCQQGPDGRVDVSTCNFAAPTASDLAASPAVRISPNLSGQSLNETSLGAQFDLGWNIVLGAAYVRRSPGRIIELLSSDGGETAILANPGEPVSEKAMNRVRDEINEILGQLSVTRNPEERQRLMALRDERQATLALYRAAADFPKPRRDYDALVVTIDKHFSNRLALLVSYTYSRHAGNYAGLYSDTGVLSATPNLSGQYLARDLLSNRAGRLPTDRPHNLRITGAYSLPLGRSELTFGLTFSLISGAPIDVLGQHGAFGPGQTFILPRGSGGRTPTLTSFDLRLAYARRLGKGLRLEASWDIFNLFDQRTPLTVDNNYTYDVVQPILRGTIADLASLRAADGSPIRRNPNYGQPTSYQPPLTMRFGVRLSF